MAPHKRTTKFAAAKLGMTGIAVALLPGVGLAGPAQAASGQHGGGGRPGGAQNGGAQNGGWAQPGGPQTAENAAKAQIAELYQQAEAATQSYDAAQEQIGKIQATLSGETSQAQRLRGRLATLTVGLGRLAAQQYRSSGVDPTVTLMFAAHPDTFLAESELVSQSATEQQRQLRTVLSDQQALASLNAAAGRALSDLRADESALSTNRAQIQGELAAARERLDLLTRSERVQVVAALSRGDDGDGLGSTVPADAPTLGTLLTAVADAVGGEDDSEEPDSTRVLKAISTAYSELGKPYVWGATGPDDFDCSGLTQHVWAAAGVALPRTSEEQADISADIPESQIEPGDLVIYFSGRTHVALYVGQGLVIHAPRPGSVVQFADLNAMPINKIVRPIG